jgi:hypothetical protein
MAEKPLTEEEKRHNRNLLKILSYMLAMHGPSQGGEKKSDPSQVDLANDMGLPDSVPISRILNGKRRAKDPAFAQSALEYLERFQNVKNLSIADIELEGEDLVRKIVPGPHEQHEIIGRLEYPKKISARHAPLHQLKGIYACAYVCTNRDRVAELGVSVDCFELSAKPDRPDELIVVQKKFKLSKDGEYLIVPTGTARLKADIIEFDIGYRADEPQAKFLAFRANQNAHGKFNFIATLLDIKNKSGYVVARPTLIIQIDKVYTDWKIFPKEHPLFGAVTGFMESWCPYKHFEISPQREAPLDAWYPVLEALRSVIKQ